MYIKKLLLCILFFLAYLQGGNARQLNQGDDSNLYIEGDGLLRNETRTDPQKKVTSMYTAGGFVKIWITENFTRMSHRWYYHAYFITNGVSKDVEIPIRETGAPLYLKVNQELVIDILEKGTNARVGSYTLKRLKLIPNVQFIWQTRRGYSIAETAVDNKVRLSPDDIISVGMVEDSIAKDLDVKYTLINLKTKKRQGLTGKSGFGPLILDAGTSYELRVNYVLQKESLRTYQIYIKPFWYRPATVYIIGSVLLLGIGLTITFIVRKKVRASKKEQEKLQQAAIRLQSLLNPHFTFNALSSVQGLMNTGRIDEANNYLQEFSLLLRQTLDRSQHVFNSLDQELGMMRMYLHLESLRFNFSWDIIISPTLNTSTIEIPTLLMQPLIENAIKHGLGGLGDKGQLLLICKELPESDTFVIVIKDNGSWLDKGQASGYGLSLTEERIRTINKMRKEQSIELTFDKENGTEAILTFHNWLN